MVRRSIAGRSFVAYASTVMACPLIRVDRAATIVFSTSPIASICNGRALARHSLDNRFDGVPHLTQDPVASGWLLSLRRPVPGRGHLLITRITVRTSSRTSVFTEPLVRSSDRNFFAPAHREEVLMLDVSSSPTMAGRYHRKRGNEPCAHGPSAMSCRQRRALVSTRR